MVTGEYKLAESKGSVDRQLRVVTRWVVFPCVPVTGFVRQFKESANLAHAPLKDRFQIAFQGFCLRREIQAVGNRSIERTNIANTFFESCSGCRLVRLFE